MQRQWMLTIAVVMLTASGAWAAIGQAQGFELSAINGAVWSGGVGSAAGSNQAMIGQQQITGNLWPGPSGLQKETGVFTQVASAGGGGPATVGQTASVAGGQQQAGGWHFPTSTQSQGMGVDFTTTIVKPFGPGSASAAQSFVGGQVQTLMTPTTLSTESQVLGVAQYASVVGGPCGDPVVNNSIKVDLSQGQMSFAPLPPPCDP
jgi:hypothetical protein